jgi:hypothetical protein
LGPGYQMLKTAGLYLVPIESYSKNNRLPWLLAPIIVLDLVHTYSGLFLLSKTV